MKTLSLILITLVGLTLASYAQSAHQHAAAPSQQQVLYYACPMHPEVHMNQPGDCPKCGMTLQPVYEGQSPNTSEDHSMHGGHVGHKGHSGM